MLNAQHEMFDHDSGALACASLHFPGSPGPIYGTLESLDNVYLFVGTREIFYPDVMKFHGMLEEAGKAIEEVCRIIKQ